MVVALPLFLQNMDSSILGTALTSIAASLHTDSLQLNLAVTAYLISPAIFMPASAWIADRFGPRRVFCSAIILFSIASGLYGAADSLVALIAFRVLQGACGAMMIPVGRLILLRCVVPELMVVAMVWFTLPPVLGRMLGPLVGGMLASIHPPLRWQRQSD
jgi:MFS family permease